MAESNLVGKKRKANHDLNMENLFIEQKNQIKKESKYDDKGEK